jgi:integrase
MGSVVSIRQSVIQKPSAVADESKSGSNKRRFRFTEARIAALPTPADKPIYTYDRDVPSLALRVTPGDVRTFVVVKKIAGKTQRITLGRWPGIKLAQARNAASRINGEVAAGRDPVAERKAARVRAETCADFWPLYLANIQRKNRAWRRDNERWINDISPRLGRKPISSVSTADCQKIIDEIGIKHPVKANRVAALLGAFFAYAIKCDRAQRNPARGLSRYEEVPRARFLSAEEVQRFLDACRAAPQLWGDLFAILLWTGARKSAVLAMRWADLDLPNGVWHISAASAKNKQAAAIPLVEPALEVLRRREQFRDNSPWVFPAASRTGHVAHVAKAWTSLIAAAGLSDLRPHDLRRTVGSWLAASGANAFVIQKALTHRSAASAKAYAHLDIEPVRAAVSAVTKVMQQRTVTGPA